MSRERVEPKEDESRISASCDYDFSIRLNRNRAGRFRHPKVGNDATALAKGLVDRAIGIVAGDNKVAGRGRDTDETNSGGDNLTVGLKSSGIGDVVAAPEVACHLTAPAKG